MAATGPNSDAFRRFVHRVWESDIVPLLRGERAAERRRAARVAGGIAAAGGLLADTVLRLKGRPFTRFMTVFGTSLGALLPDIWDWRWVREQASQAQRRLISERLARRARQASLKEALELFGLSASTSREELQQVWRATAQRWHPDKTADEAQRREYQVRFTTYRAAYERLVQAHDEGALPRAGGDANVRKGSSPPPQ